MRFKNSRKDAKSLRNKTLRICSSSWRIVTMWFTYFTFDTAMYYRNKKKRQLYFPGKLIPLHSIGVVDLINHLFGEVESLKPAFEMHRSHFILRGEVFPIT